MMQRRGCSEQSRLNRRAGQQRHNQRMEEQCVRVPVEPFREFFVFLRDRGQMNTADLCFAMGWVYRPSDQRRVAEHRTARIKPDTSHAQRVLGLRRQGCQGAGEKQYVTYDVAVRLCEALGMDPHVAGV